MATKLNSRSAKKRRVVDGKLVTFADGKAKADGGDLPLKTTEVEKE